MNGRVLSAISYLKSYIHKTEIWLRKDKDMKKSLTIVINNYNENTNLTNFSIDLANYVARKTKSYGDIVVYENDKILGGIGVLNATKNLDGRRKSV
jgi:hypothetical protein